MCHRCDLGHLGSDREPALPIYFQNIVTVLLGFLVGLFLGFIGWRCVVPWHFDANRHDQTFLHFHIAWDSPVHGLAYAAALIVRGIFGPSLL